jgi:hypothetical protein
MQSKLVSSEDRVEARKMAEELAEELSAHCKAQWKRSLPHGRMDGNDIKSFMEKDPRWKDFPVQVDKEFCKQHSDELLWVPDTDGIDGGYIRPATPLHDDVVIFHDVENCFMSSKQINRDEFGNVIRTTDGSIDFLDKLASPILFGKLLNQIVLEALRCTEGTVIADACDSSNWSFNKVKSVSYNFVMHAKGKYEYRPSKDLMETMKTITQVTIHEPDNWKAGAADNKIRSLWHTALQYRLNFLPKNTLKRVLFVLISSDRDFASEINLSLNANMDVVVICSEEVRLPPFGNLMIQNPEHASRSWMRIVEGSRASSDEVNRREMAKFLPPVPHTVSLDRDVSLNVRHADVQTSVLPVTAGVIELEHSSTMSNFDVRAMCQKNWNVKMDIRYCESMGRCRCKDAALRGLVHSKVKIFIHPDSADPYGDLRKKLDFCRTHKTDKPSKDGKSYIRFVNELEAMPIIHPTSNSILNADTIDSLDSGLVKDALGEAKASSVNGPTAMNLSIHRPIAWFISSKPQILDELNNHLTASFPHASLVAHVNIDVASTVVIKQRDGAPIESTMYTRVESTVTKFINDNIEEDIALKLPDLTVADINNYNTFIDAMNKCEVTYFIPNSSVDTLFVVLVHRNTSQGREERDILRDLLTNFTMSESVVVITESIQILFFQKGWVHIQEFLKSVHPSCRFSVQWPVVDGVKEAQICIKGSTADLTEKVHETIDMIIATVKENTTLITMDDWKRKRFGMSYGIGNQLKKCFNNTRTIEMRAIDKPWYCCHSDSSECVATIFEPRNKATNTKISVIVTWWQFTFTPDGGGGGGRGSTLVKSLTECAAAYFEKDVQSVVDKKLKVRLMSKEFDLMAVFCTESLAKCTLCGRKDDVDKASCWLDMR